MHEIEKIKFNFNKASKSYDENCQLQMQVGNQLIQSVHQYQPSPLHIIDLGCGTGLVTQRCAAAFHYQEFHAVDIAKALLTRAEERLLTLKIKVYEVDFDKLPRFDCLFDLVFANMSLQWSRDLNSTFFAIKNILQPNGCLAFSIPLAGTLAELNYHFSVQPFFSSNDIYKQLVQHNYRIIFSQQEKTIFQFDNVLSMLKSIKNVGANYVSNRISKGLRGKAALQVRTTPQLTYLIGYFIAKKDH
jgi:malonyl-CoA O-methyltransferase